MSKFCPSRKIVQLLIIFARFYAPWCGHCQNLKPAYEKAAKNLAGLAKVAAINCDDEMNKAFCGGMGVQGFPTLKIIKPSKKSGKPVVEDYQGPRSAKGIVDAVIDKIPNHVKKVGDKELDDWLSKGNDTTKAILFSDKGTTSALLKSLAVDFLGVIQVAQIRDKQKSAVEMFGITAFPTLILLPGGTREAIVYNGEMKKEPMIAFLSQVAKPNPEPAARKAKSPKKSSQDEKKDQKKSADDSSSFSAASSSHASSEASEAAAGATSITVEDASDPTGSPEPIATPEDAPSPAAMPDIPPPVPTLSSQEELQSRCLSAKSSTCLLALLPSQQDTDTALPGDAGTALASLAFLTQKYTKRHTKILPFYAVPAGNPLAGNMRDVLGLKGSGEIELLVVNARRVWWKQYTGKNYGVDDIEGWIDAIRFGEGKKEKLPDAIVMQEDEKGEDHDEL